MAQPSSMSKYDKLYFWGEGGEGVVGCGSTSANRLLYLLERHTLIM